MHNSSAARTYTPSSGCLHKIWALFGTCTIYTCFQFKKKSRTPAVIQEYHARGENLSSQASPTALTNTPLPPCEQKWISAIVSSLRKFTECYPRFLVPFWTTCSVKTLDMAPDDNRTQKKADNTRQQCERDALGIVLRHMATSFSVGSAMSVVCTLTTEDELCCTHAAIWRWSLCQVYDGVTLVQPFEFNIRQQKWRGPRSGHLPQLPCIAICIV